MMGVVVYEMQWWVNVKMLKALVEVLKLLPPLITKELEHWASSRFIAPGSLTERYQRDSRVSSLLVERVEATVEAYESCSATSLQKSSEDGWREIRQIIATGEDTLTPHGVAWVVLCYRIETLQWEPSGMKMLEALVEVLKALSPSIVKEVESWGSGLLQQFIHGPLTMRYRMRYRQDTMVLPKLVGRVEAMVRAYESCSATSLQKSSEDGWGEIDWIIDNGKERLTSHGMAWVELIHQIEAILILVFSEA